MYNIHRFYRFLIFVNNLDLYLLNFCYEVSLLKRFRLIRGELAGRRMP